MRSTHRVALYREGEAPDGGTDRRGTVESFGQPEVSGVDARVAMTPGSGVEDAPMGRRSAGEARAMIPQSEIDGFTPKAGDGLRIESGDWTHPEYWHVVAVPQPGTGRWDVVLDLEANSDGFD